MTILLTAFEPFGGEGINASLEAMRLVEPPAGTELLRLTVPTVFGRCTETVLDALCRLRPDAVVCLGQAAGREAITPERRAVNLRNARIPDNEGFCPVERPVVPGGEAELHSTLPVEAMCAAILARGIPARISESAGTFVCNDLMYGLLHALRRRGIAIPAGFIHVPCLPEQAKEGEASMALACIVEGIYAALDVLPPDAAKRP